MDMGTSYKPGVRFNFDLDTLVISYLYLQGHYRFFEDAQKLQRLIICYNNRFNDRSVDHLTSYFGLKMEDLTESVKLIHQNSVHRLRYLKGHNLSSGCIRAPEAQFTTEEPSSADEFDDAELMSVQLVLTHDSRRIPWLPLQVEPMLVIDDVTPAKTHYHRFLWRWAKGSKSVKRDGRIWN